MDREELLKLHAALGAVLALPDSIRELLVKWLETSKPNGHDPHPPVLTPTPPPAKARRRKSAFSAKTAERKLLAAMADNPGLSVIALANAAGSSRSATGERLRQMALRGTVEKDLTGRWKLKGEERPPTQGEGPGPQPAVAELTAPAEAEPLEPRPTEVHVPWIRPLVCYDRRVTSEIHRARYG
jgi:hypothetical protein